MLYGTDNFWKQLLALIIIYSVKYTVSWSEFEIPKFFIVENSKQYMNFYGMCYNCDFLE